MLVVVTLMIASVGFSILGSGTVSTLTLRFPCHVTAFIAPPSSDLLWSPAFRCPRADCPKPGQRNTSRDAGIRDVDIQVGLIVVELTAVVGGDPKGGPATCGLALWISNRWSAALPHPSAVSSLSIDDGMAMTVTPHDVNNEGSRGEAAAHRTAAKSSVAVAATGVIFSCAPIGADAAVVKVHGDIDMRSAPILAGYVCSRVEADKRLILDLSDVGFFGIAGLTVFTALDEAVDSVRASWSLVEGHPVRRLLQATSVVPKVKRFSTVEDALA